MNNTTLSITAVILASLAGCAEYTETAKGDDIGQGCPTHEQDFHAPMHKNCGDNETSQRAVTGISPSVTPEPEPEPEMTF